MEVVLTKAEQAVVWEGWLGSEIRASYFAELSRRFQERQRKITWLQLLLSSGAVAGGIAALAAASSALAIISPILALATAGLSYYSLLQEMSAALLIALSSMKASRRSPRTFVAYGMTCMRLTQGRVSVYWKNGTAPLERRL